ncbi:contact-dependent growth inhibition system immunity protein [Clostridium sp.]|uniref:contact-dependent growth inhibition system immunity protein n=1 Tax=Clostridium sp. TaxID=1506 RepID=UPI00284878BA|nr:contact-dependent growth inhibition system immunity protein [Clostridium sp.]MDR3598047.1 contact-dependent growth inhibition system immunity protein [Clostridium sp.]
MFEELKDFLSGTFHQDISSSESAIKEYAIEVGQEYTLFIVKCIKEFLNSNFTEEEKNNFIERNTELYFPAIDMTPVEWLEGVMKYYIIHL